MLLLSQFCAHGATRPPPAEPPPPPGVFAMEAEAGAYVLTGNPANLDYSGPPNFACVMTAGDYYTIGAGYFAPAGIGLIDAEPLPGHTLQRLLRSLSTAQITFSGDAMPLLAGRAVWVNGIAYTAGFSGWSYTSGPAGGTSGLWTSGGPTFVVGQNYIIEFKA